MVRVGDRGFWRSHSYGRIPPSPRRVSAEPDLHGRIALAELVFRCFGAAGVLCPIRRFSFIIT